MPFMDEPPGAHTSSTAISIYGRLIKALRTYTNQSANKEPQWRHRNATLTTGYQPTSYAPSKR